MSKLTTGGGNMPAGWSMPSPLYNYKTKTYDHGGIVWVGDDPATLGDLFALVRELGKNVDVDIPSMIGKKSPEYSNFRLANLKKGDYYQVVIL